MSAPWFTARRLGFGWRPATWKGWFTSGAFIALVIGVTRVIDNPVVIAASVALLAGLLALVCFLTGGRPGPMRPGDREQGPSGDE